MSPYEFHQHLAPNSVACDATVDAFVADLIRGVDHDMRRQPAHMVYEMLLLQLRRRLPGVEVNDEVLLEAAARIAAGLPVT